MADHRAPAGVLGHPDGGDRLGQRPDLVELDQDGVGRVLLDAPGDPLDVGDEEVVADELDLVSERFVEELPAGPVVLGQAVLQADDRVGLDPAGPELDHLRRIDLAVLRPQEVKPVLKEAARRRVEGDGDISPCLVARFFDGLEDLLDRFGVGLEGRSKPALVAHPRGVAARFEDALQGMIDLGAPAECFPERGSSHWGHHEFLEVGGLPVGVGAAVEDVEHRDGKKVGRPAA